MTQPKKPMNDEAARRIQRDADKNKQNQDFKRRAQRAAEKNKGGGRKK